MIQLTSGRYFGEVLQATELAGLRLSETLHPPEIEADQHRHESPYFCFVLAGGFAELADGRERECGTGDLIFHHAAAPHANRFHPDGARCLNLELGPYWARREPRLLQPKGSRILRQDAARIAGRVYDEFRALSAGAALAVEGLVLLLLAEIRRVPEPSGRDRRGTPDWVVRARQALDERYRESWSLSGLADELQISPTRLARAFRESYGCSVGQYVHRLRVREACRQLARPDRSLSSIATATGFADQSHLTRIFRRYTGTTPGRYRERLRS